MCFSLQWLENILIWLVVVVALVAIILKLIVPTVLSQLGWAGNLVMQIVNIVVWAFVLIVFIMFAFGVIGCLLGAGGLHWPGWGHA